ncbi:MAG: zinc ribbon domain-containing protein [Calditrichaeota bacterium]|nr:MAG: zinc ribbon domain-containing protein [Calditrichota bacterium]
MPTYEYKCKDCGFNFEEFQSIVSDPLTVCPQCQGRINRVIAGGAGLIFKGSGFYLTDYKNKSNSVPPVKTAANNTTDAKSDTKTKTDMSKS